MPLTAFWCKPRASNSCWRQPLAGEEVDVVNDFLNEQFREIDDDMVVRSQFKVNDFRILRRAFIGYIRSGVAGSDESKRRDLFKRMLRREGK
jgi:hypothetical protein